VSCIQSARQLISDNVVDFDTAYRYDGLTTPAGALSVGSVLDWSVKRNTFLGHNVGGGTRGPAVWGNRGTCTGTFGTNFEWSYNINDNGVDGDCRYDPENILTSESWLGTVSVTSNLVADVVAPILTSWQGFGHESQIAATEADIKLSADYLTLQGSSPFFGMGIGANLSCFNEAAIRAGTPSPLCPLPPEAQSGPLPPDRPIISVAAVPLNPQVYPNPWRKDRHTGGITFNQVVAGGTIKIFTISGRKVREIPVTGTSAGWDLANDKGDKVASGIYVYLITDGQGNKAKGKVGIIK